MTVIGQFVGPSVCILLWCCPVALLLCRVSSLSPFSFLPPPPLTSYRFTIILDDWMLLSSEQKLTETNSNFRDETLKTYKTLTSLYSSLCNHLQVSRLCVLSVCLSTHLSGRLSGRSPVVCWSIYIQNEASRFPISRAILAIIIIYIE